MITLGEVDGEKLQQLLGELLNSHTIYRAKGFAALPNKPMRQVVQAVGKRLDVHFDRMWNNDEARLTQLVFIGKDLVKADIEAALAPAVIKVTG